MNALNLSDRHVDETVEFDTSRLGAAQPQLQIIEGTGPDLSRETWQLLKFRLRTASLLLFGGYAAFLLWGLFTNLAGQSEKPIVFGLHVLATCVTGMIGMRLCNNCPTLLKHLRLAEALVFGTSALFFAAWSYHSVLKCAEHGQVASISGPWFLLMFTYALFMPNTWLRSLFVIGPMAALPVLVMLQAYFISPEVREVLPNYFEGQTGIVETFMMMTLGATIAVWGVRTIGSLRREAFEARQLGQYQLKRLIGSGGMGQVYIAEHKLLKRPCAIKLIRPEAMVDPKAMARFEREVQATAKLTHWNTVDIYDYGRADDGTFYYVMEYLPGMSLGELVERYGPMAAGRVVYMLTQTCEALGEAHSRGMVHRDIKPANIFAAKRGRNYDVAKLLDFGLVREATQPDDVALTAQHAINGSPQFMSPEQATGNHLDHRSDIYSLGAVAYTLLTGQPPFKSENPIQLMVAHANQQPQWPADLAEPIPDDLARVVMRCLAKNPEDRFQSVDELSRALQACECSRDWDAQAAASWWQCNECPDRKRLDAAVLEGDLALSAR